jgi:aminoglycoside phosphotransferase (APT) family kinase protein
MSTVEERFAEDVLSCVDDLNAVLPRLAARYEDLVIIAALAEHVGGALRIFMHAGICSPEQARRVLAHVEDTAFARSCEEEALDLPDNMQ